MTRDTGHWTPSRSAWALLTLLAIIELPVVFAQTTGSCELGVAQADLDYNNVRARLYNTGGLFWRNGTLSVYNVPQNTNSNAIFASGIWVGGLVNGQLRMAGTTYGPWEFWPGPLDGAGNPPSDCRVFDRIYSVTRLELERYEDDGIATADILQWPVELGAPVVDGDGDSSNYNLDGGDRPGLVGDQTIWWVMNDAGNTHNWSQSPPIGLEVQVTAFAFNRTDALGNSTFYKYRLINKGRNALDDVYFGIWADADLGFSQDDFVGSDSAQGLGYIWNGADFDPGQIGYGSRPPALGYDFLQGPLVDGERLGMTSFIYHNADASPQGNPADAQDLYNYMRGLWKNGAPMTRGGTGLGFSEDRTRFMFPGNPPDFWSEENVDGDGGRNAPGDRRFVLSTGPFELEPGTEQEIVFAIIWSQSEDRFASVRQLRQDDLVVQAGFDYNFGPGPSIDPPAVAYSPFDRKVILRWESEPGSDNYLNSYDQLDPYLAAQPLLDRTYTFEGYNVFRFDGPDDHEGTRIATFDVANGVTQVLEVVFLDPTTGLAVQEPSAFGTDSGLQLSIEVDRLTNYAEHYFGVQAYAFSPASTPRVITSEISRITVVPSPQAPRRGGTVINAAAAGAEFSEENGRVTKSGQGRGTVWVRVVDPSALTGDSYRVDFSSADIESDGDPTRRVTTYDIVNTRTGELLFDGNAAAQVLGRAPPQKEDLLIAEGLSWSIVGPPPSALQLPDNGGPAFVQISGISDRDACGRQAGSRLGCDSAGGNGVYRSLNGEEDWIMLNLGGTGPEERIGDFTPSDFELRVTERGSYAHHTFTSGRVIHVPFELWDIGPVGPFGVEDPADDVQLIPSVLSDNGGDCFFGFGEISEDPFNLGWPVTDRIYGHYPIPSSSYADWENEVRPLVTVHPDGCAEAGQTDPASALIDFSRRPLQRIVFTMDPADPDFRAEMIPEGNVIRFFTTKPNIPGDEFLVETAGFEPVVNDSETAGRGIEEIAIVPNPYLGVSAYELSINQDLVRIVNLPQRADIRVFTVAGVLVMRISKDDPSTFYDWDLTNDSGLRLGSGMYLVHVTVPEVGETVIKFGIRQKRHPGSG